MRTNPVFTAFVMACALTMWSCGGGSLPSSPSVLNPLTAPGAGGGRLRTLEDPPPAPMPDPNTPSPMAVIINIIGSFGAGAFMPNPTMANMGDQIVFTNTDAVLHHIVLDDGTDLGDVAPGQSSAPMPLTTPTATFHCTIHPSMVGSINGDMPAPDPYYPMPPSDDYYGYY
jgi:plastocyanin